MIYGVPGATTVPGTDHPLNKSRADYKDYRSLRRRIESYGVRLAAIEGGFLHSTKYHDTHGLWMESPESAGRAQESEQLADAFDAQFA